jgi:undecaprenyl-diphosphatase
MADRMAANTRTLEDYSLKSAIITGCCQALAVIPGVSRSGITITAGLFMGFERTAAARFSFLLSVPIIAGAGLYEGIKLWQHGFPGMGIHYLWGFISALVTGYVVIAALMRFLQTHTFTVFIIYRLILAGIVALSLLFSA